MKLVIEFSDTEAERLRSAAARLGVEPSEFARAAVSDFLGKIEDPEFRKRWLEGVRARKDVAQSRLGASEIIRHRDADRR